MVPPPGIPDAVAEVNTGGSGEWFPAEQIRYYTNVFLVQDDKILLGYKKRGLGIHKYNGFGGKVEPNESTLDAAARELQEEAGITAPLEHVGVLLFVVPGDKWAHIDIFRAMEYSGTITESDEMRPEWFKTTNIPFDDMWDADRYWLPLLLSERHFSGRVDFEKQGDSFVLKKWWFGIHSSSKSQGASKST
ncbi:NUDIX hydrolase domain-like protein [Mycena maculata]|uniref:Oxidized purine nucleoside triphosphate hydrolase n=1 Tax=Mycena maculata TaxID=230809 RepID=A0AAD7N8Q2_9AGAR|nr:NUDIX hydrolase domain-like protein [Mycena maculata]